MEELISLVPADLRRSISESSPEDLGYTCRSLLDFLLPLPQFQRVVRELTDTEMGLCKKSREAALELKKKGNDCFVGGDFAKALSFYSQALRFAPTSTSDVEKNLLATLYVNRASSMHKLGLLEECKRDCGRALLLSPVYVKAWYRRGKANLSLKNYEDAVHDLEAALGMESSSSGKNHIKEDLEMALSYFKSTCGTSNSSSRLMNANMGGGSFELGNITTEPHQVELQCISTQAKGKGMVSLCSIPPAGLIHSEEPLAVIVLKNCRETHCHFCLDELPTDVMFCSSCAIPSYCSQQCQEKAIEGRSEGNLERIPEHRHECGGVNWPAVLPSDVVLVGRVMAKLIEKRQHFPKADGQMEILDFVHHYARMPSESKLESHIFSIVLSFCLNHCFGSDFPFTGASVAQLVIVMCQMKVNSMAIVRMNSLQQAENILTSNIEQLRVGQAIYSTGRLFNHSCRPNIHAYFLSRKLLLRSTEFIPAGFPLELSYGPQVGQWGLHDRQKLLEDQYFFKCQCSGCSELNLSDLVINAFRCVKPTCFGAVLEDHLADSGMTGENFADPSTKICSLQLPLPVSSQKKDVIDEVAHVLLERPVAMLQMCPGFCLNCCSKCDLKSLIPLARTACVRIDRLKNAMILQKSPAVLPDALRSLSQLRSVRHAYSKDIAQAEDTIAETFCAVGDLKSALEHSKASIKILEKLYHDNHIVIGNELVKLASLQLSLGDHVAALHTIDRLEGIFSLYYGTHAAQIISYLKNLRRGAE
uniref:SET and MYND domain-containing protein 3 n=1 Tax=Anthurium amnicola TaxID=1678845 RepID=A0A1D1ZB25_9ARAE